MSSHVTLLPLSARLPRQQVKQRKRAGVLSRAYWDGTPGFLDALRSSHSCSPAGEWSPEFLNGEGPVRNFMNGESSEEVQAP